MGAVAPNATVEDALGTVVEGLSNRLAANGLSGDMARHWSNQLALLAGDSPDAAITDTIDLLRSSNGLTASEAARLNMDLRTFIQAGKDAPSAFFRDVNTVIDSTAKAVDTPPTEAHPQGSSGQVPSLTPPPVGNSNESV
jgi:hypothetical protein